MAVLNGICQPSLRWFRLLFYYIYYTSSMICDSPIELVNHKNIPKTARLTTKTAIAENVWFVIINPSFICVKL